MELFKAEERSIRDILSKKEVEYHIPRNQRDYVWEEKQWKELINDICDCIGVNEDGVYINSEYFIGSCVLEKYKRNIEYIVDGQQRLTTISIILSVLFDKFKQLGHNKVLESIYSYLCKRNDDGDEYFTIKNESLDPYYSEMILLKVDSNENLQPQNEQQKRIQKAYFYFDEFISKLISEFEKNEDKIAYLVAFRNQLLNLKIIEISVGNEIDGYTVFEILNAKGKQLQLGDRMKNLILKKLPKRFPTDQAKLKWDRIKKNIEEVSKSENNFSDFINHYWISTYKKLKDEDEIYYDFKSNVNKLDMISFLEDLELNSEVYKEITLSNVNRISTEFEFTLNSFKIFRNKQVRPIILSFYHNKRIGKINEVQLLKYLRRLENFHFIYSAITSTPANRVEKIYQTYPSIIKHKYTKEIVDSFFNELESKKPDYQIFERNFILKGYSHKNSDLKSNRSLVSYILQRIEYQKQKSNELLINELSIEHISNDDGSEQNSRIGNLLPLAKSINENCGNEDFSIKKLKYKNSNFLTVRDFLGYNSEKQEWTSKDIDERTKRLAQLAFDTVWK